MASKSSGYPDCFKDTEYGVSGGIDACPECGSTDYSTGESGEDGLVALRCRNCGQNYALHKNYVEGVE